MTFSPVLLGIDFGGTKIATAVSDLAGRRLASSIVAAVADARAAFARGVDSARELLSTAAAGWELAAVGVSMFGISTEHGVELAPSIDGWRDIAMSRELRAAFGGTGLDAALKAAVRFRPELVLADFAFDALLLGALTLAMDAALRARAATLRRPPPSTRHAPSVKGYRNETPHHHRSHSGARHRDRRLRIELLSIGRWQERPERHAGHLQCPGHAVELQLQPVQPGRPRHRRHHGPGVRAAGVRQHPAECEDQPLARHSMGLERQQQGAHVHHP
jgi:hypothetical protein